MDERDKPFSTQWYTGPASRRIARRVGSSARRRSIALLAKMPSAGVMRVAVLALLILASPWLVYPRTFAPVAEAPQMRTSDLAAVVVPTVSVARPVISTTTIGIRAGSDQGPLAAQSADIAIADAAQQPTAEVPVEGSLLPAHRIVLLYGLPGNPSYGMLGMYDNLRLLEIMQEKAEAFRAIDPDRPILFGFQIIASVAQNVPGSDGSYLRYTSISTIYQYIEFTRANDLLLVLEAQIGRTTMQQDVQRLNRYLLEPHVHLAIDPQFDVERTEIPTQDAGSTTAADIRWVQEYLVDLTTAADLPPKVLIVHQFTTDMIVNKPLLRPVRGVQLVITVGLWGTVEEKTAAYTALVTNEPVEFGGIMISGAWDTSEMTPEDVVNLPGAPDVVIYQ